MSITISSGGTATFSVLAIGDAPMSYQWKKEDTNIPGMLTSSYSPAFGATNADVGNYTVAVTNEYGTTLSNAATLTVNGSAPASPNTRTSRSTGGGGAPSYGFFALLALLAWRRRARCNSKRTPL